MNPRKAVNPPKPIDMSDYEPVILTPDVESKLDFHNENLRVR